MFQKTKIVATIGPATQSLEKITELNKYGVSFLRLNMSHGDHSSHEKTITLRDQFEKKNKKFLGIIADLCGPKIRIGDFANDSVCLKTNSLLTLTTRKVLGTESIVFINYPSLCTDLKPGNIIMLDDGKKSLVVVKIINKTDILTKVITGGDIKSRRGVNMPDAHLSIDALTAKDKKDVSWGIKNNVDFFALSFVRNAKDIEALRKMLNKNASNAKIIAKIETPEAVKNIDAIIEASDAIMVARGDLAIEIGAENVPHVQKQIITKCNNVGKPVITATQMLESMVRTPVPTRAEISDIANAIFDGTDALMLSEETAVGSYPVEAVSIMSKTACKIESNIETHRRIKVKNKDLVDSVSSSVVHVAEDVNAKIIVALTESGFTARVISRYRPVQDIIAVSSSLSVSRQSMLSYGVTVFLMDKYKGVTSASLAVKKELLKRKLVTLGDQIVLSAGVPFGKPGSTNTMLVTTID